MALIRDIGHSLENFKTLNKMNHDHHPKSHKNSHDNRQEKSGKKTTDRKDKGVELKGIPVDILEERKKADMCLKCGKGPHKWYECFSKQPVTTRTTFFFFCISSNAREERRYAQNSRVCILGSRRFTIYMLQLQLAGALIIFSRVGCITRESHVDTT